VELLISPDSGATLVRLLITGVGIYLVLLVLTRVMGLRSFSKMASMDFATTVALGAVLAATITSDSVSVAAGSLAFVLLFLLQRLSSWVRMISPRVERLLESRPLLLVACGAVQHDHLAKVRMTESDLQHKLRASGATCLDDVFAAILETTGEVTVVLRSDKPIDRWLFETVRGADRLDFGA
jgi:uncharacterized membrane protein YcaP (DUF421 family)